MSDLIEIPKYDHTKGDFKDQAPCWVPCVRSTNNKEWSAAHKEGREIEQLYEDIKPHVVCKCGKHCNIDLHHVHEDGRVTESFYHYWNDKPADDPNQGCGWHVYLKLLDYDRGEFLPAKK